MGIAFKNLADGAAVDGQGLPSALLLLGRTARSDKQEEGKRGWARRLSAQDKKDEANESRSGI